MEKPRNTGYPCTILQDRARLRGILLLKSRYVVELLQGCCGIVIEELKEREFRVVYVIKYLVDYAKTVPCSRGSLIRGN